jgi:hypothetical protein
MMNWKVSGSKRSWPNFKVGYYSRIRIEVPRKRRKTCQDGLFPGQDLNLGPQEYEAGVLIT